MGAGAKAKTVTSLLTLLTVLAFVNVVLWQDTHIIFDVFLISFY
jgi:hypothetical protein